MFLKEAWTPTWFGREWILRCVGHVVLLSGGRGGGRASSICTRALRQEGRLGPGTQGRRELQSPCRGTPEPQEADTSLDRQRSEPEPTSLEVNKAMSTSLSRPRGLPLLLGFY